MKDVGELRCKPKNPQLAVEKQNRNLRGRHQALEIPRQRRKFVDLVAILLINRSQLLIHALELLLRGLELLHCRVQLLIRRLQLLVGGLHLLLVCLVVLDEVLQALPGAGELVRRRIEGGGFASRGRRLAW